MLTARILVPSCVLCFSLALLPNADAKPAKPAKPVAKAVPEKPAAPVTPPPAIAPPAAENKPAQPPPSPAPAPGAENQKTDKPPQAAAASSAKPSAPVVAPAEPAAVPTAKEAAAREHFFRGVDLYSQGSYAQAWLEFSSAYQLIPKTLLLNNMARCEARIGRPVEALQHYKQFIAAHPDDSDAPNIRQEIARLEGEIARRGKNDGALSGAEDAQPVTPSSRRIPAKSLAAGGVTVGLLVAGIATLGLVNSRFAHLQSTCVTTCPPTDVSVLQQQSYAGFGLLGGAGATAALTGLFLYFELGKKTESELKPIARSSFSLPGIGLGVTR